MLRRKLLVGLLAAPLVVRDYSVLMPVRSWLSPHERELLANGFTYVNGVWRKRATFQVSYKPVMWVALDVAA